jgi:hypothetical protein
MSKEQNISRLRDLLKHRLQSSSKIKSVDVDGNVVYVDCDIYNQEMLNSFIELSVSDFNQVPYFTFFTLADDKFVDVFSEVLVEGATLYALSSQALIEKGREFKILDNGIYTDPPNVSEMLNTQYCALLNHHWEKLKTIKNRITEFKKMS